MSNSMNSLEFDLLTYSEASKTVTELERLKGHFNTKERWDDARKLDADSFVRNYGIDYLKHTSMDFDLITERMMMKEKLCVTLIERIEKINSSEAQFAQKEEDLRLSIQNLSLANPRIQKTMSNQAHASTYDKAREYPKGFGYLPTLVHFDPTYFTEPKSLTSRLVPSAADIYDAPLLQIDGQKISFCSFGETETGGISQQFSKYAEQNVYKGLKENGKTSFKTRGLINGIASSDSFEDFHIKFGNSIYAIFEIKGAEGTLLGAVSQAAVSATNVAMSLLSAGLPQEDCVVPAIATNGLGIIFGAIIVLDKSFPTYIPVSKLLDLSSPQDSQIASAYLTKACTNCEQIHNAILKRKNCEKGETQMLLYTELYFVKKYTPEIFERGIGLFDSDICNFSVGLHHILRVFNKLYTHEAAREVVEFPLSVRTADQASEGCHQIIYRDLRKWGYTCGAPNRIEQPALFEAYKVALFAAVDSIHKAGVLHCDLYISNVMWKSSSLLVSPAIQDDSAAESSKYVVEIKIVDWDASHCLDEGQFAPMVLKALHDYFKVPNGFTEPKFGVEFDLIYLSVLNKNVSEENSKYWYMLSSDVKEKMDFGYRNLFFESY